MSLLFPVNFQPKKKKSTGAKVSQACLVSDMGTVSSLKKKKNYIAKTNNSVFFFLTKLGDSHINK